MGHIKFFVAAWMCVLWLNFNCINEVAAFGECYVVIKDSSYGNSFAGSLVTTKCVLTAADPCRSSAGSLKALAGVTSGNKDHIQTCNVDEVLIHPKWNPQSMANDFALLLLVEAFRLCDTVVLIPLGCLITESSVSTVVFDNIHHPVYEEVKSELVSNSYCAAVYNQSGETCVCAEQSDGSNAFKHDDMGTGLIQNKKLIGVLIGVAGRDYMGKPNVFTSIKSVYNWIWSISSGVIKCVPRYDPKPYPIRTTQPPPTTTAMAPTRAPPCKPGSSVGCIPPYRPPRPCRKHRRSRSRSGHGSKPSRRSSSRGG